MRKTIVLIFIFIFAMTGFSLQNSKINKASEDEEIARAKGPLEKASVYIKFADKKVNLIQSKGSEGKLTEKGKEEELYPLINEYRENIDRAYGEIKKAQALGLKTNSSLDAVNRATSKHLEVLNRVLAKVPEQAKSAIRHAIEFSQRRRQQALQNLSNPKGNKKEMGQNRGAEEGKASGRQKTKVQPIRGEEKKNKKHNSQFLD